MNLKQTLLGTSILGVGLLSTYAIWDYFPKNTEFEELARPLATLVVGLTTVIAGGKLFVEGIKYEQNRNPSNPLSNTTYTPRKRKYVEKRIDEYGREYRIEREETIE